MSHRKSLTLLAAGVLFGVALIVLDSRPSAIAQSTKQPGATPSSIKVGDLPEIPLKEIQPAFPTTENPDVARIYATAYIVGEVMRSGLMEHEQFAQMNPVENLKNVVRTVYAELGGE